MITAGELIDLFRNFANERPLPEDVRETAVFWKREDILQYLNLAQVYYNAFINNLDESYNIFEKSYSFVQAGEEIVELLLPEDCQKIKLVERYQQPDDTYGVEVMPMNIVEKFRTNILYPNRYYLKGNRMVFNPIQTGPCNIRLYYLMRQAKLVTDTDLCTLPDEVHENIAVRALILGLLRDKQGSLANYWKDTLKELDKSLVNVIKPRQTQQPETVMPRSDWSIGPYVQMVGF